MAGGEGGVELSLCRTSEGLAMLGKINRAVERGWAADDGRGMRVSKEGARRLDGTETTRRRN